MISPYIASGVGAIECGRTEFESTVETATIEMPACEEHQYEGIQLATVSCGVTLTRAEELTKMQAPEHTEIEVSIPSETLDTTTDVGLAKLDSKTVDISVTVTNTKELQEIVMEETTNTREQDPDEKTLTTNDVPDITCDFTESTPLSTYAPEHIEITKGEECQKSTDVAFNQVEYQSSEPQELTATVTSCQIHECLAGGYESSVSTCDDKVIPVDGVKETEVCIQSQTIEITQSVTHDEVTVLAADEDVQEVQLSNISDILVVAQDVVHSSATEINEQELLLRNTHVDHIMKEEADIFMSSPPMASEEMLYETETIKDEEKEFTLPAYTSADTELEMVQQITEKHHDTLVIDTGDNDEYPVQNGITDQCICTQEDTMMGENIPNFTKSDIMALSQESMQGSELQSHINKDRPEFSVKVQEDNHPEHTEDALTSCPTSTHVCEQSQIAQHSDCVVEVHPGTVLESQSTKDTEDIEWNRGSSSEVAICCHEEVNEKQAWEEYSETRTKRIIETTTVETHNIDAHGDDTTVQINKEPHDVPLQEYTVGDENVASVSEELTLTKLVLEDESDDKSGSVIPEISPVEQPLCFPNIAETDTEICHVAFATTPAMNTCEMSLVDSTTEALCIISPVVYHIANVERVEKTAEYAIATMNEIEIISKDSQEETTKWDEYSVTETKRVVEEHMISVSSTGSGETTEEASAELPHTACTHDSIRGEEIIGESKVTTMATANTSVSDEILTSAVGMVQECHSKEQMVSTNKDETDSLSIVLQDTSIVEETGAKQETFLDVGAEISTQLAPQHLKDGFSDASSTEVEVLVNEEECTDKTVVLEHTKLVESVLTDGGETTDSGFITTDIETETFESCDETTDYAEERTITEVVTNSIEDTDASEKGEIIIMEQTLTIESVPVEEPQAPENESIEKDVEAQTLDTWEETSGYGETMATIKDTVTVVEYAVESLPVDEQMPDTDFIQNDTENETCETWEETSGYGEEITTTRFKEAREHAVSKPYDSRRRPATVVVRRTLPGDLPEWFEKLEKLEKFIWQLESSSVKSQRTRQQTLPYRTTSVDRKLLNTPTAMVSRSNPDIDTEWMWLDEIMTVYQWNQVTTRSVSVDRSHQALCRLRALEGFGRSSVRGRPTSVVIRSGADGARHRSLDRFDMINTQNRLIAGLGDRPATFLPHRTRSDSRYTAAEFTTDDQFQSRRQERDESLNRVAEFLSRSASRRGYSGDGGHRSRSLHRRVRGPTAVVTRTAPDPLEWETMSTYEKLTRLQWSRNVYVSSTERRPYSLSASVERRTITMPTAVVVRSSRNLQERYDSIERLSRLTRFEWSSHSRTRRVSPRRISVSRSPTRRAYSMPTAVVHRARPDYSYSSYSNRLDSVERLTRMQFTTVRGPTAQTQRQLSFATSSLDRRPANFPTAVVRRTVARNTTERDSTVQNILRMDDIVQRSRHISPSPQPRLIIKTHHRPRSLQKPTVTICRSENPAQSGLIWPLLSKERARSFAGAYTAISTAPSLIVCNEDTSYRSRSHSPRSRVSTRKSSAQKSCGSPRYHLLLKPANVTDSGVFSMSDSTDSSLTLSRDSTCLSHSFNDSVTSSASDTKSDSSPQLAPGNVPRYHILLKQGGYSDGSSQNQQDSFEEWSETKKQEFLSSGSCANADRNVYTESRTTVKPTSAAGSAAVREKVHTTARIRPVARTGSTSPPVGQEPQANNDITVKHRVMSWEASNDDVDHLTSLAENPSNDLTGETERAPSHMEDIGKRWNDRQ